MPKLYILCGPSGSGKSTWAQHMINTKTDTKWVSRDKIRLSLLKEGEDYFAHEKDVFKIFVESIADGLKNDWTVIADATHLNMFSRLKLMQALDRYTRDYEVIYVVFHTDADTCIERNKNRTGRANVPENIIRNMCRDFRDPTFDEDDRVIAIQDVITGEITVKDCRNCKHGFIDEQFNIPLCHNNKHCKNFEYWEKKN